LSRLNSRMRLFLLAGVVLALVVTTIATYLYGKRTKAEQILDEVRTERWSSLNFESAKEISQKYGGYPGTFARNDVPCTASSCRFDVSVTNFPLDYLHLAPKTGFYVSVRVKNNSVDAVSCSLLSVVTAGSPPQGAPLGAHVQDDIALMDPTVPGYISTFGTGAVPGGSTINVGITAAATPDEKRAAFDFNMACLTKLGGCKSARDFLPRAAGIVPR
jgi:hypothetical protein